MSRAYATTVHADPAGPAASARSSWTSAAPCVGPVSRRYRVPGWTNGPWPPVDRGRGRRMNRYGTSTTLAAGTALALTGCTGSGNDLYGGEQTAEDVLPEDVAVDDDWDTSTSRLPASPDGHEFPVLAATTGDDRLMTCSPQRPGDWVVGCGPAEPPGTTGPVAARDAPRQVGLLVLGRSARCVRSPAPWRGVGPARAAESAVRSLRPPAVRC